MREAASSPTRTAARPGMMPLSDNAWTRSATSERICAEVVLPSRILAVTAESYRPRCGSRTARSVSEVARPGEDHRHPVRLRRREDLGISLRSSRMDHGRAARLRGDLQRVGEGEERVGGEHGALRAVPGLPRGDPGCADASHSPWNATIPPKALTPSHS